MAEPAFDLDSVRVLALHLKSAATVTFASASLDRLRAIIDAFAQHLEHPSVLFQENVRLRDVNAAREQGRREILAEIAKIDEPSLDDGMCLFCSGYFMSRDRSGKAQWAHKPDCLYLRAQSLAAEQKSGAVMRELIKGAE